MKDQREQRRRRKFIARALASRDNAKRTGVYVRADAVIARLEVMLAAARAGK
ncbi:MAG: hypothetical protein H7Z39_19300 [Burkholderiaceae bacterium]|nr:hypothetical protein [Burkholderiaceae bacterium]